MNIQRGNLEILLKLIPYYKISVGSLNSQSKNSMFHIDEKTYIYYAKNVFRNNSDDEIFNNYKYLNQELHNKGLARIMADFANELLEYTGNEIQCKIEELLRWREISFQLSEDIFTCAYLAKYNLDHRRTINFFAWSPIIFCNDIRLKKILEQGIAENHFHLNGSTKVFELNWISIMNIISGRGKVFQKITKNLQMCFQDKTEGENFYEICQKASLYRLYLFSVLKNNLYIKGKTRELLDMVQLGINISLAQYEIQALIDLAKNMYGAKISKNNVLDYSFEINMKIDNDNECRLLSGERKFMYDCFQNCLTNKFNKFQSSIFYRYLLIRTKFRSESVQVNRGVGFSNFSDYQDRKELFIEGKPLYENELVKLALNETLSREYLKSLEARICPNERPIKTYNKIKKYKEITGLDEQDTRLFYVLHFPKLKDKDRFLPQRPRHYKLRGKTEKEAKSIVTLLRKSPLAAGKIRGIDACSSEIGCRPENFAQAYRFLADVLFRKNIANKKMESKLCLTYHVGEDFLDIVDGLRAIDESIIFCGLQRGSRIGHALALGIEPYDYYQYKGKTLTIEKQILLDDIAWLLYKANELGVIIELDLKTLLEKHFYTLFNEIYGSSFEKDYTVSILDYYMSWKLRGDNPMAMFEENDLEPIGYARYKFNTKIDKRIREIGSVRKLYRLYHFSETVRKNGNKVEVFNVHIKYPYLVREIQNKMIQQLVCIGIGIETNPSSNYLIGTIKKYDEHPIIRFNGRKLNDTKKNMSLSVSINTDDQGVFDTLLENEYALMELALRKEKNENGENKYDIEDIYEWLDYVRKMGLEQVFN